MAFGSSTFGSGAFGSAGAGALTVTYTDPPASETGTDHMATTNLDVANAALCKLGCDPIDTLLDNSNRARVMNARIEWVKWAALRLHPWNFATRRSTLSVMDVENVVNGSGKCRITITAHGLSTNDQVVVEDVGGTIEANGNWTIGVIDADRFDLQGSTFANAYTSGGTVGRAAEFGYTYQFPVPTDFIRLLSVDETSTDPQYRVEEMRILSDSTSLDIKYIANITNYGLMDVLFRECFSTMLAIDTCIRLTQSNQLLEQLNNYLKTILPKTRFVDGVEDALSKLEATDFITSRFSPSHGYLVDAQD